MLEEAILERYLEEQADEQREASAWDEARGEAARLADERSRERAAAASDG